ncbi:transcription cofactor vestigial-like protein 1 [Odontesthes bonariensis]|uniref:transcription cofactor vestigial-like protein 1 n=1 Tax=Odontesthes bonariensis TaxID=219752 RepID=UPI003F58E5EC
MEERTGSPIAVKVEGHSHSVLLTYFQGDINSMVDAHFTRALSKVCKAKEPAGKTKKIRKTIKTEDGRSCQDGAAVCFSGSQDPAVARRIVALSSTADSPGSWHSFTSRTGEASGLPTIMCSLSSGELSLTGQQYATSLLNLLHSDRPEMGPSTVSNSKPEPPPSWTVPQGFRESADPPVGFETGRHVEKKDLYWY